LKPMVSIRWHTRDFNRVLQQFTRHHKARVWDVLRKVAFDVIRAVAIRTPVDTGRARAAWVAFLERNGVTAPPVKSKHADNKAIEEGRKSASWRFSKLANTITVTNGVHYITALEFGSSQQAPEGMLRRTLAEFKGRFIKYMRRRK